MEKSDIYTDNKDETNIPIFGEYQKISWEEQEEILDRARREREIHPMYRTNFEELDEFWQELKK